MAQSAAFPDDPYLRRVLAEKNVYASCLEVHDLPSIFHYWSDTYIRPMLEQFGFSNPQGLFENYLLEQSLRLPGEMLRVVSLGSGNGDLEIALARFLRERGRTQFVIDCLELNPAMLERTRAAAAAAEVAGHIQPIETDLNQWEPSASYHAALANQSLHHVVNLEGLFAAVRACLAPEGSFIVSDIIGRNGHLRWPEALAIVHEFWRRLPPSYRFNHRLRRYEPLFQDWDCSLQGFEGIRAQDILPLLVSGFHFRLFIPFGNVIDPFVDRTFGSRFDPGAGWDRAFIDEIHRRDEREISVGNLKPTHMLAVLGTSPSAPARFPEALSPEFCIRLPDPKRDQTTDRTPDADPSSGPYEWGSWPHSDRRELEIACRRLEQAEQPVNGPGEQIEDLNRLLTDRGRREQRLIRERDERTLWAQRLNAELAECTAWAQSLDAELIERTAWAGQIAAENAQLRAQQAQTFAARWKTRLRSLRRG